MSEEERQQIERVKEFVNYFYSRNINYDKVDIQEIYDIEGVLQIIEKQQGKIDKVKNQLKNQIEHCENENAELYDKCSINLKFNKGLLKLLEE